jgi:hypothetical protein
MTSNVAMMAVAVNVALVQTGHHSAKKVFAQPNVFRVARVSNVVMMVVAVNVALVLPRSHCVKQGFA